MKRISFFAVLAGTCLVALISGWAGSGSSGGEETMRDQHRGWAARKLLTDRKMRDAYVANWRSMKANYGETVDFQLRRQVIVLTPESAPFLYQTPDPPPSAPALNRPELEQIVQSVTRGSRTDREKVLALMRYVRDLYRPVQHPRFGGTEEALIARGDGLCESLSRLMVGLCEIAGFQGRIVLHVIGGHLATEIGLEGRWAYLDARSGLYFLRPDGRLASAWDLKNHPEWLARQPRAVRKEVSKRWKYDELLQTFRHEYFHPREVIGVVPYSLRYAPHYSFRERTWDEVTKRGLWDHAREYRIRAERVFADTSVPK